MRIAILWHLRSFSTTTRRLAKSFPTIDPTSFPRHHFETRTPCVFPRGFFHDKLPAFERWFNSNGELNTEYLLAQCPESQLVPVEITTKDHNGVEAFEQASLPWSMLLGYLSAPSSDSMKLYLAQHPGPDTLLSDIPHPFSSLYLEQRISRSHNNTPPTPPQASKLIDVYSHSLWLGLSNTAYTPLHRDPNDNIFVQLSGKKRIRCFPPEVGQATLKGGRGRIRGIEMMTGEESRIGWAGVGVEGEESWEIDVEAGDGIYMPLGWWHTVKGLELNGHNGVVGSINWWFR